MTPDEWKKARALPNDYMSRYGKPRRDGKRFNHMWQLPGGGRGGYHHREQLLMTGEYVHTSDREPLMMIRTMGGDTVSMVRHRLDAGGRL